MLELVYSTNVHGISLKTLYRNFEDYDTTALLVVRDENDRVSVLLFGFQTCLKVWLTRSRLFPSHSNACRVLLWKEFSVRMLLIGKLDPFVIQL